MHPDRGAVTKKDPRRSRQPHRWWGRATVDLICHTLEADQFVKAISWNETHWCRRVGEVEGRDERVDGGCAIGRLYFDTKTCIFFSSVVHWRNHTYGYNHSFPK